MFNDSILPLQGPPHRMASYGGTCAVLQWLLRDEKGRHGSVALFITPCLPAAQCLDFSPLKTDRKGSICTCSMRHCMRFQRLASIVATTYCVSSFVMNVFRVTNGMVSAATSTDGVTNTNPVSCVDDKKGRPRAGSRRASCLSGHSLEYPGLRGPLVGCMGQVG